LRQEGGVQPTGPVLVTGAFGLVGGTVVRQLVDLGVEVVATDLDISANREAATALGNQVEVRWADLTQPDQIDRLFHDVSPCAIVHLAAVIPPHCYARPKLARAVNVDATAHLVRCAEAQLSRPRFVLASSIAVYGARNPHHTDGLLTTATPLRPSDVYGAHKAEAEAIVRSSGLDWLILRLGGVLPVEPSLRAVDLDTVFFEASLPADGRVQVIDVRDVARAFCSAISVGASREIFLIAGDDSTRIRQGDIAGVITGAVGLVDATPRGRPGNPSSDHGWFTTDWMDTSHSQKVLDFQRNSFPDTLAYIRSGVGGKRWLMRAVSPLARMILRRKSPYFRRTGTYAEPWDVIRSKWGAPDPDTGAR
jgi:nucleoside-diphosphate-sugar epimerase